MLWSMRLGYDSWGLYANNEYLEKYSKISLIISSNFGDRQNYKVDINGHWFPSEGRNGLEEALVGPVPNRGKKCVQLHI